MSREEINLMMRRAKNFIANARHLIEEEYMI